DALSGLTELCSEHPNLLVSSLGSVVNGVIRLFIDEDRDVRRATYNFLKNSFTRLDKVEIQPFISLLVIYTCSAMTHILEDIRVDAVKLMDIWTHIAPDIIVTKFWNRVIGNYMSLLAVNSTNMNAKTETSFMNSNGATTTASVKAAVNKSHLHIHKTMQYWFMMNYLDSEHAKKTFKTKILRYSENDESRTVVYNPTMKNAYHPIHPLTGSIAPNLSHHSELATFSHLHLFESSGPKASSTSSSSFANSQKSTLEVNNHEFSRTDRLGNIQELIEIFQPILVASWLEAAPSVFISVSTISFSPALELLHAILKFSLVLWRAIVGSDIISELPRPWLNNHLQTLIKHFSVYFPFGVDSYGHRPAEVDNYLQQMNIMLCELTSLFMLARKMQTQAMRMEEGMVTENDEMPEGTEVIVDYVLGVLGHHTDNKNMSSASTQFQTDHLVSLLPAIWGFLNCLNERETIVLFEAFVDYYTRCQPNSSSKRVSLEFISCIYMVSPELRLVYKPYD
ncbi:hypothetical protein BDB01DRAFT_728363, partial [Pilobolus umbonatus]